MVIVLSTAVPGYNVRSIAFHESGCFSDVSLRTPFQQPERDGAYSDSPAALRASAGLE